MRTLVLLLLGCLFVSASQAQISAKLFRYADISDSQIVFVYGGDIWLVPKSGGTAAQVTHSPGEESWPRFSPDGSRIAYTASYNGNEDVYVMPSTGGLPIRVTYQSHADRLVDWHPDGERLVFASPRERGLRGPSRLFIVDAGGGLAQPLPMPYGELASFAPDGNRLAYITKITERYPFKRYLGGLASDIIVFDLGTNTAERITDYPGNDGKPAWVGDDIYFVSDRGPDVRLNVWKYDTNTAAFEQVTNFADFDVTMLSAGGVELVFEAGGQMYLLDTNTGSSSAIDIDVVSDISLELPRSEDVSGMIRNVSASPEGKRVVFEARGELFNAPVKDGFTLNMTQASGSYDRDPAWSPDGETVAYWSDKSGEYEIHLAPREGHGGAGAARQLTNRRSGYGYTLHWSPDSKKLAFIDEKNDVVIADVASGELTVAANTIWNLFGHSGREGYPIAWSPDSRWIAFTRFAENHNGTIVLYNVETGSTHEVTRGFYDDQNPVFSTDGKYLFYLTDRNLSAAYSALDATWIYPNVQQIASVGLTRDVPSLLAPRNDVVGDSDAEEDTSDVVVTVDPDGFESRIVLLPPGAGNYGSLMAFEGKLVYRRSTNTGADADSDPPTVRYFDLEEREEKTIVSGVGSVEATADGASLLISSGGKYGIVDVMPDQEISDPIPVDGLLMELVPREEWRQIFTDTWRRHRDMFYDPNMHGVDWDELRARYGALVDEARTRWDIAFLQSELASELSAGHTYTRAGDTESVDLIETGFLGIDWRLNNGKFQIGRIVRPAAWDTEVRSPLDRPGLDVAEGDYIHAVNGRQLDPAKDPYAAFEGLAGSTVSLTVSRSGESADARQVLVELLTTQEERTLRHLEWIENNRRMVDELSDGKLGYVYMTDTSTRGQLELVRMYYGQLDREGFVIDERFNGGGQLADRFLELLTRPVVYNLHWRNGRDHTWPFEANTGPMGMLINGWAGSGGDGLPWAFQELEAGPIVGERTVGILVGPATGHTLIDGGGITVPGARLYDNDGHWFWEGEGVTPDIEVWDDPNLLVQGRDPQIERVVVEVLALIPGQPSAMTPAPALEDRSGRGGAREN